MRILKRISLLVCIIFLGVFACVVPPLYPAVPTLDATSAAQTVIAIVRSTQGSSAIPLPSASETPNLPPPTYTSTPTLLVTSTPVNTATAVPTITPLWPGISVSVATNCRSGPSTGYDIVGYLPVGVEARIYARSPTGTYWYIQNPDGSGDYCWVSGKYATLYGLTSLVPIFTPPPTPFPSDTATPKPGFDASYAGLVSCKTWWPQVTLKNTGSITFESMEITLKDTVSSMSFTDTTDGFVNRPDCVTLNMRDKLLPGKKVTVAAPVLGYNPTGHKLRLTITLCSDTGMNGTCISDTISFTP